MKKNILLLLFVIVTASCGTTKNIDSRNIELSFLDDFIIPENLEIGGTKVGGLSGIDHYDGTYYLVCDHPGNPRFYKASIGINQKKIDTVLISEVIELDQTSGFFKNHTLDLEAIRYNVKKNELVLSSEGSINNGKDPSIFHVNPNGEFISNYSLPGYFLASGEQKPRNNGAFEGLVESYDKSGYWAGMELPLEKDGSKPKLFPTKSPIRITHFNLENGKPTRQFVMQLENITKIPWLYFAVNGLTELLEYAPNRFLVLERAFSAGHGTNGNTVRIFDVDARNASNTLNSNNLRKEDYTAATKKLVFDFKSVRKQLKENIIDNLEGMTFGPDLPNGNKTLLLVSDDNFSSLGKQISQIILMEVEIKN
ncbi:MAG: esterase-like activity of phytase family protein [Bacteroidota bacterium]